MSPLSWGVAGFVVSFALTWLAARLSGELSRLRGDVALLKLKLSSLEARLDSRAELARELAAVIRKTKESEEP